MKNSTLLLGLVATFASSLAISTTQAQTYGSPAKGTLDGGWDGNDWYGAVSDPTGASTGFRQDFEQVAWYNGHGSSGTVYGDKDGPSSTWPTDATIRWGVQTDASGTDCYLWLYIEAPLYSKNMIWDPRKTFATDPSLGMTASDAWEYGGGWEPFKPQGASAKVLSAGDLDYSKMTGSEKVIFTSANGQEYLGNLPVSSDLDKIGPAVIGHKDALDYLVDKGLIRHSVDGTTDGVAHVVGDVVTRAQWDVMDPSKTYSVNRDQAMSFEFVFDMKDANFEGLDAVLGAARNGLEFHLSPARIPEPSSTVLLGLASMAALLRRKR